VRKGVQALNEVLEGSHGGRLRPANTRDLRRAQKAGFPRELLAFYKMGGPDPRKGYVELDQRIYSIGRALDENRKTLPSDPDSPHGFVVFAANPAGDVYCVDTNVTTERKLHPVVWLKHEVIAHSPDILDLWYARVEVASSVEDFLFKVSARALHQGPPLVLHPDTTLTPDELAGQLKRTGIQALKWALRRARGQAGRIRPAKPKDLDRARRAGFPRELIAFYSKYEPDPADGNIELDQRLYSITAALRENRAGIPGKLLSAHGYVAFAGTTEGDPYCVDTNVRISGGRHPIVLFAHDTFESSSDLAFIQASRVEVASSLDNFLLKFSTGQLSEETKSPNYEKVVEWLKELKKRRKMANTRSDER